MTMNAPSAGPDPTWEEVYGPNYPWNWITAGELHDCPVLDNGLVRIHYDEGVTPGFRVEVWNGTAYVEQGKMIVYRNGDTPGYCNTWVSAGLHTDGGYTPDRAVAVVVLAYGGDLYSRERIFITVQRGELGVTFECYPALKANGTQADAILQWTPALNGGVADFNNSIMKVDSLGATPLPNWTPGAAGTAILAATAGSGAGVGRSGQFGGVTALGNANFSTSENWAAILRCPTAYNLVGAYQTTLTVLQDVNAKVSYLGASASAYGIATDSYQVASQNAAGLIQCQVQFGATQAQQILECEAMTLGAGTTAGGDLSASGLATTQASRATDANSHVSQATWPNSFLGTYRVFLRAKTTATRASFYAKTGASTGSTVTLAGAATPAYTWIDLGEITANNTTFELHSWVSSGPGIVECDRIEAVLVQDRARTTAIYSGARDGAQAALYDSRAMGSLVAR